jgi:hypothetical protein
MLLKLDGNKSTKPTIVGCDRVVEVVMAIASTNNNILGFIHQVQFTS